MMLQTEQISTPHHADQHWHDFQWRMDTFCELIEAHQLSIEVVCQITGTKKSTAYSWRASQDQPITPLHLRLLMLELERGAAIV